MHKGYLHYLRIATALLLAISGIARAQEEPKEPPKLLKGGFVQQLRALSEEAISNLQSAERANSPAPQPPRVARPPQPSGRAVLRRTHQSPWIERFQQDPAGEAQFSLSDKRSIEQSLPRQSGMATQALVQSQGLPGGVQPTAVRQPVVPGQSTPQFMPSSPGPVSSQGAVSRPGAVSATGPRASFNLRPDSSAEVHVETELPEAVLEAIGSNALNSYESYGVDSDNENDGRIGTEFSGSIAPALPNQAPKVSRIPLPGSGAANGSGQPSSPSDSDLETQDEVNDTSLPTLPEPSASRSFRDDAPSLSVELPTSSAESQEVSSESVSVPTRMVSIPTAERKFALPSANVPGAIQTDLSDAASSATSPRGTRSESLSSSNTADEASHPSSLPELPQLPVPSELKAMSSAEASRATSNSPAETPRVETPEPTAMGLPALPATANLEAERAAAPSAPPTAVAPKLAVNREARPTGSKEAGSVKSDERMKMETPRVEVLLVGPGDIPVERPEEYQIIVINHDDIDLGGLILRLDVPPGVLAKSLKATHGEVEFENAADGATLFTWAFEHLAPGGRATAPFSMLAKEPRNFAVAMEWTVMPLSGEAGIDVLAPRLEMALEGPSEVQFGQANTYRLRIRNPGTAPAENVAIELTAEPYGASSSNIGTIAAGSEEIVDVELTFNEKGSIKIAATATAANDLASDTSINVLVKRPSLVAEIVAPAMIYHGSHTEYRVSVGNDGDADASSATVRVALPSGSSVQQAPENSTVAGSIVSWPVTSLPAGSRQEFALILGLTQEGENRIGVDCSTPSGLRAESSAVTLVEAIADLKLVVNDPIAPAPIGTEVTYELTLTNRGSKAATNVKVIAQFSEGIEPIRAVGQTFEVVPGQLFFDSIPAIAAGETVHLQVIAKAERDGTHRFRAEVRSLESEHRLVHEESTQYLNITRRIASPPSSSVIR